MEESIEKIVNEFRKHLQADGGDIEIVEIADGLVKVRITRTTTPVTFSTFVREYKTRDGITCGRCRIPTSAIVAVLELKLKEKVPRVTKVEVVE